MGDKIRAKETVKVAGVPVVPGSSGSGLTDAQLTDAAREIGTPVLLKPSAGGGGKGMRLVRTPPCSPTRSPPPAARPAPPSATTRCSWSGGSTGPGTSRSRSWPTASGNVVHLGERECSLQRRHQKIIEEAPSVLLDEATRAAMGEVPCRRRAPAAGRAGTVEFIVPGSDRSTTSWR
ncbi:hypothetical protein LV779_03610 [Streptomyces thinghirensis]|nr:hypothetical protein [Streptomyces thinghirensis]